MQRIEISDDQFAKLTAVAQAAGYEDVAAFAKALADESEDPRGSLSKEELRTSAAECARINEEMKAGAGRDALEELGQEFGFKTPQ